jgi:hypothetical protein
LKKGRLKFEKNDPKPPLATSSENNHGRLTDNLQKNRQKQKIKKFEKVQLINHPYF